MYVLCVCLYGRNLMYLQNSIFRAAINKGYFIKYSSGSHGELYFPTTPSQRLELRQLYLHTMWYWGYFRLQ